MFIRLHSVFLLSCQIVRERSDQPVRKYVAHKVGISVSNLPFSFPTTNSNGQTKETRIKTIFFSQYVPMEGSMEACEVDGPN